MKQETVKQYTVVYTHQVGSYGGVIVKTSVVSCTPSKLAVTLLKKFDCSVALVFEGGYKPIHDWSSAK